MDDMQATCHCHQGVIKSRTGYESLDSIADGFHTFYYNQSTVILGGAEQLYEKMLDNITNKVATSLSDNMLSMSTFAQNEFSLKQAFHPNFDTTENNTRNVK
jgi:hypothetical protein